MVVVQDQIFTFAVAGFRFPIQLTRQKLLEHRTITLADRQIRGSDFDIRSLMPGFATWIFIEELSFLDSDAPQTFLCAKTFPTMAVTRRERPMRCGVGGAGGDKFERWRPGRDSRRDRARLDAPGVPGR